MPCKLFSATEYNFLQGRLHVQNCTTSSPVITLWKTSCGELYTLSEGSGSVLTELASREEDGWGL